MSDRWLTILVWGLWCIMVAAAIGAAQATPSDGGHGAYHEWFAKQMVPDETTRGCCAESDGHVLEEEDWKIIDGEYTVRTGPDGAWTVFPNTGAGKPKNTILGFNSNPTGKPVAWWTYLNGKAVARCFAPGTLS